MKRVLLFLLFILLVPSAAVQEKDPEIKIGEKHIFHSKSLNEDRPYWVYLPESLRSHLNTILNHKSTYKSLILSSMGISELGLNLFFESEETIQLRQLVENDSVLREKILDKDDPSYTPTFFNYFPQSYYIEAINKELVITSFKSTFLPFIRYNTQDRLRILSYQDLEQMKIPDAKFISLLPPFKSPLILMYGKNEVAQFDGQKIYPPQIQKGLYENFSVASKITGYFKINNIQKVLEIQLKKGIEPTDDIKSEIQIAANTYLSVKLPVQLYSYVNFPHGMELDYLRKFKYL